MDREVLVHVDLVLDTNIVVSAALKPDGLQRTVCASDIKPRVLTTAIDLDDGHSLA
jgi:hypothetical protein